jgi:hypothetical protein
MFPQLPLSITCSLILPWPIISFLLLSPEIPIQACLFVTISYQLGLLFIAACIAPFRHRQFQVSMHDAHYEQNENGIGGAARVCHQSLALCKSGKYLSPPTSFVQHIISIQHFVLHFLRFSHPIAHSWCPYCCLLGFKYHRFFSAAAPQCPIEELDVPLVLENPDTS